jgi:hypothetical protein
MKRRGVSLIELIVVIGVETMLLSLAVTTIATLIATERNGRRGLEQAAALDALRDEFRRDVRLAAAFEQQPNVVKLTLHSGRRVEYAASDDGIARREHQGNTLTAQEYFRLPGFTMSLEATGEQSPRVLRLKLSPPQPADEKAPPALPAIEAVLGGDLAAGVEASQMQRGKP